MSEVTWKCITRPGAAPIYQCWLPDSAVPIGGVVDYTPATPPYLICMVIPPRREWSKDDATLDEAKQRVVSIYIQWKLTGK